MTNITNSKKEKPEGATSGNEQRKRNPGGKHNAILILSRGEVLAQVYRLILGN